MMGGRTGNIDTAVKSVAGDTAIIIIENGKSKRIEIGKWIDNHLENNSDDVKNYEERNLELLDISENSTFMPTTDEKGNVNWKQITAITRHDPGDILYKIKTLGGREVIVTESKSLLIWNHEKYEYQAKSTPDVKIGDFVPVTCNLSEQSDASVNYNDGYSIGLNLSEKIPAKYFNASEEFIFNLLHGCISKNGYINKNNIKICSKSEKYLEGISILCSRMEIFAKRSKGQLLIENNWKELYCVQNDTILDKIVSMDLVDVEKYPKVYDLTVPSTLNFGLANGLHVVDTADSGYTSRKLMKALEDVKVLYDGTVRNANNNIVQFIYGDDGFDPIKLEKQKMDLIELSNLTMEERYKFSIDSEKEWENIITKKAMKELLETENYQYSLNQEYETLTDCREKLRNNFFKNLDVMALDVFLPVNLYRFIHHSIHKFNLPKFNISDLNPVYIIKRINNLCDYITKYMKESDANELTKISIKSFLSSKMVIMKYRLNKITFDYIVDLVGEKIMMAYVQPGEMVGPVAAQSVGEANTQLTLNSLDYEEKIMIRKNGETEVVKIGEFIDNIIDGMRNANLIEHHPNDTELRYLKDQGKIEVISINEDGKINWEKVDSVTRHPIINEDGTNTLLKVTTRMGRTVTATKAKSFLTRKDNKVVPIRGDELKVGDHVPIMINFPINGLDKDQEKDC